MTLLTASAPQFSYGFWLSGWMNQRACTEHTSLGGSTPPGCGKRVFLRGAFLAYLKSRDVVCPRVLGSGPETGRLCDSYARVQTLCATSGSDHSVIICWSMT